MSQNMTDEELDRDWQPNGRRPQSTLARSFSQELGDIFRIENSVNDLDERLGERKKNVKSQETELEALERRIREMEQRLKRGSIIGHPRPALPTADADPTANRANDGAQAQPPPPPPKDDSSVPADKPRSRPGTARQNQPPAPSSANMPPTPTASEGEYHFVGKDDLDDHFPLCPVIPPSEPLTR
ncbi:hypothetical protein SODALDRAFT_325737 [Sodiomyces alkalinus F11]|uniref:Uncharacterized protein n=1 Tax=Sodiomyces alkalinus (strain CBS 110278 / VKM F-3762 / F11) TaxID=1314773 RepID=A0A3N2PPG4_SODAK|nr:hypothetical protein SODALDRAFT_325737 [Sodiomyces alkalinus F11]ROT36393.1 hypothetical protein SODALDRAFT_325737 [Sodiomyces alkalinus F11]